VLIPSLGAQLGKEKAFGWSLVKRRMWVYSKRNNSQRFTTAIFHAAKFSASHEP